MKPYYRKLSVLCEIIFFDIPISLFLELFCLFLFEQLYFALFYLDYLMCNSSQLVKRTLRCSDSLTATSISVVCYSSFWLHYVLYHLLHQSLCRGWGNILVWSISGALSLYFSTNYFYPKFNYFAIDLNGFVWFHKKLIYSSCGKSSSTQGIAWIY